MSAPFTFQPIHRTCLALNGRDRIVHGDDIDPRPLVRIAIPGTAVSYLLTETHPEDAEQAYGLIDDGDGAPRIGSFSLREAADRGGQIDDLFVGEYRISHYAAVAALAGRTVTNNRSFEGRW